MILTKNTGLFKIGTKMDRDFKKGFEKNAGLLTLLGSIILPSVQKRVGAEAFEYSKRKELGVVDKENKIFDSIHKQIDKAEKLPHGTMRKKVVDLAMNEGPGIAVYMPSQQGRNLGKVLDKFSKSIPFGLGDNQETREFLARLTSSNGEEAAAAAKELTQKVNKVKTTTKNVGLGALGSLGAYLAYKMMDKKEGKQIASPPNYIPSSSYPTTSSGSSIPGSHVGYHS